MTNDENQIPADSYFKERGIMRIRVEAAGPEPWRLVIKNADTGEILPTLAHRGITIDIPPNTRSDGLIWVHVKLLVSELDITGLLKIDDQR